MKKLLSLLILLSFNIKAQMTVVVADEKLFFPDVTIGTQTWTSINLHVTKYRNGDKIPQVQDAKAWAKLKTGAWCYYENKKENGTKYGKLYNWFAVNDKRGLAPKGYHIPSEAEWKILTESLGGKSQACTEMKSKYGWKNNGNGTNTSSFAGLPGGERLNIYFVDVGAKGSWWSSSEAYTGAADYFYLDAKNGNLGSSVFFLQTGFSVRCIKD